MCSVQCKQLTMHDKQNKRNKTNITNNITQCQHNDCVIELNKNKKERHITNVLTTPPIWMDISGVIASNIKLLAANGWDVAVLCINTYRSIRSNIHAMSMNTLQWTATADACSYFTDVNWWRKVNHIQTQQSILQTIIISLAAQLRTDTEHKM